MDPATRIASTHSFLVSLFAAPGFIPESDRIPITAKIIKNPDTIMIGYLYLPWENPGLEAAAPAVAGAGSAEDIPGENRFVLVFVFSVSSADLLRVSMEGDNSCAAGPFASAGSFANGPVGPTSTIDFFRKMPNTSAPTTGKNHMAAIKDNPIAEPIAAPAASYSFSIRDRRFPTSRRPHNAPIIQVMVQKRAKFFIMFHPAPPSLVSPDLSGLNVRYTGTTTGPKKKQANAHNRTLVLRRKPSRTSQTINIAFSRKYHI